jgi:hypothetical protein
MARYIAVGKETTYGQDVAQTEYVDAIDDNLSADNGVISDQSMGARGNQKPAPGLFKTGRTFKVIVEPENIGLLLLALMGTDTPSTLETGVYKHVFTPGAAAQYLTLGGGTDVTGGQRTNPGFAVRKAKFSSSPGAKLLAEFDGFGKSLHVDALASPSFSTKQPFHHVHSSAKIATVAKTYIKAMTIEVENQYEEEDYTLGSRELRSAPLKGFLVKGTMDVLFDQLDTLKLFLGSTIAAAPLTTLTKQRLDLTFTHDILAGATQYFQINFIMLETLFKVRKDSVNKRERMIENLDWECFVPTAGTQFTIELVNNVATY